MSKHKIRQTCPTKNKESQRIICKDEKPSPEIDFSKLYISDNTNRLLDPYKKLIEFVKYCRSFPADINPIHLVDHIELRAQILLELIGEA